MNVAAFFQGSALTFSITGEGVSIDPATGELSIATETLREGVTVLVTARNAEGAAEQSFTLTVAAEPTAPEAVAPTLVVPPQLQGSGRIGETVAVISGDWAGVPAPELGLQWLCDDKEIAGATEAAYVPGPEDDGHALTCRVTATNAAGTLSATPEPILVVREAPVVVDLLPDVEAVQGAAPMTVEAAAAFDGAGLVFTVAGANASIDAATGTLSIPADAVLEGETVTVTATNSGGSVDTSFLVTVVVAGPVPFPPALPAGAWSVAEVRDAEPEGRRVITIAADVLVPEGFELRWYSGREPGGLVGDFNRVMTPGETYVTTGTLTVGITCHNVLYWRRIEDDAWQLAADEIAFVIAGLEADKPLPVAPAVIAAPTLAGSGEIGSEVSVDTGTWSGTPAPAFTLQWLRDGAEIAGVTAATYVPGPEDDRTELSCRASASNAAGTAEAETAALAVVYPAPTLVGELLDEVFDQETGPETVAAAPAFAGGGLVFSVTGAGASIDAATGVISIPTDVALSGEPVVVTAANSGGSVETSFLVTVEVPDDVDVFPPALDAGDWSVAEVRGEAPAGRRVITIDGDVVVPDGFELRWYSGTEPGGVAADGYTRGMSPGETYVTSGALPVGETCHNVLYWRRIEDDAWEPSSAEIVFVVAGLETGAGDGTTGEVTAVEDRAVLSDHGGIRFNFAKAMPTGRYVNGDWFVSSQAAPVSIVRMDPPFVIDGREKNGAESRYGSGGFGPGGQGFDGSTTPNGNVTGYPYQSALNVDPANTGKPLVFAKGAEGSVDKGKSGTPDKSGRAALDYMARLTIVNKLPPEGAFRPGADNPVKTSPWTEADMDLSILPNVAAVPTLPEFDAVYDKIRRPHMHTSLKGQNRVRKPKFNEETYGREYAGTTADAALMLCTNIPTAKKRLLAIAFVQLGIDIYERAKRGGVWEADGALNCGRKLPLLFAAILLNDQGMKNYVDARNTSVWKKTALNYGSRRNAAGPLFMEDRQTNYIDAFDVANSEGWYQNNDIGKPEWQKKYWFHPTSNTKGADGKYTATYRSNNSHYQWGTAIAAMLIPGGRKLWGWEPFFEYCDHWEPYFDAPPEGNPNRPKAFHKGMWNTYRDKAGFVRYPRRDSKGPFPARAAIKQPGDI